MFEKCDNCGQKGLLMKKTDHGVFCSKECADFARHPGFCQRCSEATTDVSAGSTHTINGIGTRLYFAKARCQTCNSIIQSKFFCVFFIPVVPQGRFRVIYTMPQRYISRELNPNLDHGG